MKRKVNCIYCVTAKDNSPLTDTATAYLDNALRKMAYQTLLTNFQKSGNPRTLAIMATAFPSGVNVNNIDYKSMLDVTVDGVTLMKKVTHKHKKMHGVTVECKPFVTMELTEDGKAYLQKTKADSIETETTITFDDYVMQAWVRAMELNSFGLLTDFDSVWNLRTFIYRPMRATLKKEYEQQNKFISLDENGNNKGTMQDCAQMDILKEVETSVEYEQLCETVKPLLRVRDKELAIMAWSYSKLGGYSMRETATIMDIDEKQVRRYVSAVQNVMQNVYA